tara:strand:- start:27 stop:578 length:552 start_codon:yes stop_codon:yes gene_type:complete
MFKNLNDVELSTRAKYITSGIHTVKITKLESSTKTNPNAKTPYLDFHMETADGALGKARIYGDRPGQTEKAADYKAKMLKELLVSAGVKDFSDNNKACMQAIGGKVKAVFATREYWTTDSEGTPVIKAIADYKFATDVNKEITFDPSWNRKLSAEDMRAYNDAMQMAGTANADTATVVDDMPF